MTVELGDSNMLHFCAIFLRALDPAYSGTHLSASRAARDVSVNEIVRERGFEPPQVLPHWLLRPARLPIPPLAQKEQR